MEACCCSSSPSILTVHSMDPAPFSARSRPPGLGPYFPPRRPAATPLRSAASRSRASLDCRGRTALLPLRRSSAALPSLSSRRRPARPVSAVFERFTERAIKAVVFSQREARALGGDMVFTQHLLLGLVAEDRSPDGFLGSGITIDRARDAVRSIWTETAGGDPSTSRSATDVPFSISTKRVFEAAVEFSRNMGCNFIAPEHIAIGLFTVDDGSAGQVLKRSPDSLFVSIGVC